MESVDKQLTSNGKRLGGCTGRGFKPGQSGNPKGRPKRKTLLEAIRDELARRGATAPLKIDEAAKAYVDAMLGGSFPHAKEVIEREDGTVPEDVRVEVVYVNKPRHEESAN